MLVQSGTKCLPRMAQHLLLAASGELHRLNIQPCCLMQHTIRSGQTTEKTAQQQLSAAQSRGQARCDTQAARRYTKCQLSATTPKPCAGSTQQPCLEKDTGTACPTHLRTHPPTHPSPPHNHPHAPSAARRTTPAWPSSQIQHSQSHTADSRCSILSPPLITQTPQGPRLTCAQQGCANHAGACTCSQAPEVAWRKGPASATKHNQQCNQQRTQALRPCTPICCPSLCMCAPIDATPPDPETQPLKNTWTAYCTQTTGRS